LTVLRQSAETTQEEMARHLGVTQSAISKLEAGRDEGLTTGQISGYSRVTNERNLVTDANGTGVGRRATRTKHLRRVPICPSFGALNTQWQGELKDRASGRVCHRPQTSTVSLDNRTADR